MWWVLLVDLLAVVVALALLGLAGWRLVVRPALRFGSALGTVAGHAGELVEALSGTPALTLDTGTGRLPGHPDTRRDTP